MEPIELIMLGTGNAAVTRCYNTCFAIKNGKQIFLTDAGGGNGILSQLEKANLPLYDIKDLFVTHAHTDHILGAVWVLRMVVQQMQKGAFEGDFQVYGHDKVIHVLQWICQMTLPSKIVTCMQQRVKFQEVKSGDSFDAAGLHVNASISCLPKKNNMDFVQNFPMGRHWSV